MGGSTTAWALLLRAMEESSSRPWSGPPAAGERQRELYSAEVPFVRKWRRMEYLQADFDSGVPEGVFELQAMAPGTTRRCGRVGAVLHCWIDVLTPAFDLGLDELGADKARFPTAAVVSLVTTFNQGVMLEHLSGVTSGHDELLAMTTVADQRRRLIASEAATLRRRTDDMRARQPDRTASPRRRREAGVRGLRRGGQGRRWRCCSTWQVVHSRHWKAAGPVPGPPFVRGDLLDGRGTGRSSRPVGAAAYLTSMRGRCRVGPRRDRHRRGGARALSCGSTWAVHTAADHPDPGRRRPRPLGVGSTSPNPTK